MSRNKPLTEMQKILGAISFVLPIPTSHGNQQHILMHGNINLFMFYSSVMNSIINLKPLSLYNIHANNNITNWTENYQSCWDF